MIAAPSAAMPVSAAGLEHLRCAASFWVFGGLMSKDRDLQTEMGGRMVAAIRRAHESDPDATEVALAERVRQLGTDRAAQIHGKASVLAVLDEVNACERRYEMPLTELLRR